MEPGVNENLMPTAVVPEQPSAPAEKLEIKDPEHIVEIKKAVSFLESQRLSNFNDKFDRSSQITYHGGPVNSLTISGDYQYMASCSSDFNIYAWMVESKQMVARFTGHRGKINSVSFCENASFLASGSDDKTVKLWNMRMRKEEHSFTGHTFNVLSVSFSPDGKIIASSSMDKSIILWNIQRKSQEHKFNYGCQTMCLAFTLDSRYFASGGSDNQIKVHNVFAKRWELGLDGHSQSVLSVAYSSTAQFIASGSMDQLIKVWNAQTGKEEFTLKGHTDEVFSVNFSKDVNFLVSGSKDKTVRVWDIVNRVEIHLFNAHSDTVTSVLFINAHKKFVSASADSKIQYWDLNDRDHVRVLEGHKRVVSSFSLSSDEKFLVSSSGSIFYGQSGELIIWNTDDLSEVGRIHDSDIGISVACLSKDDKIIATGQSTGKIKLYDFATREEKMILEGHNIDVNSIDFSLDGKWMVSASGSINHRRKGNLILWNWTTFTLDTKFDEGHEGWVAYVKFFNDSIHIAAGVGCSVVVWDITTKSIYCSLNNFPSWIQCITVSPDNKYIVSGDRDKNVRIWNYAEKRLEHTFTGKNKYGISCLAFSPDSHYLMSGSYDSTICVWNFKEKLLESKFEKHSKSVSSLFYSPSMKFFLSGSEDEKVFVWNLNTLTPYTQVFGYPLANWALKFTDSYETVLQNTTNPAEVKVFSPKEGKETQGKVGLTLPITEFDPFSVYDEKYYEFFTYYNAIYCISYERYHLMDSKAWKVLISNYMYTPLHFATFKGQTKIIADLISSQVIYFRADGLGRSPLYYSILAKHQAITDMYLDYLITLPESFAFERYYPVFYSVRNDLSEIIINSSPNLCDFLGKFLYCKDEPPYFGVALNRVKFITSVNTSFSDFVTEHPTDSEPFIFKTSLFELPANCGSQSSIELLNSFLLCRNKDLFKVPLIRNFIRSRWEAIRNWIYMYTALLWTNLVLLAVLVDNEQNCASDGNCVKDVGSLYFVSFILFVFVNILLFVWEIFQLLNKGFGYFTDFWNLLDVVRVILTTTWLVLQNMLDPEQISGLEWFVVFINLTRGVTGFRAFDTTRYYVGLIITSLVTIRSFLFIFVYTILAFGLLSVAAHQGAVDFYHTWGKSFILAMADFGDFESEEFNIVYLTYLFAIIFNVVLMFNMIISILGDAFDEFQLFGVYYDNKEMTQVILEIEEIFSVFKSIEESKYLHICVNAYEVESKSWQGKVLDVRNFIKENICNVSSQVRDVTSRVQSSQEILQNKLINLSDSLKNSDSQSQEKLNSLESKIDDKIQNLESSISNVNSTLSSKIESLDQSMINLSSKLDAVLSLLAK